MAYGSGPNAVTDPARLAALESYAVIDTPEEQGFDDIVHLAAQACATPAALVSLVAAERQWFKARVGFDSRETDLNRSVCVHALTAADVLVIPDLAADPRTMKNPLVTAEPFIRFYAGAPLRTPSGQVLGSLCVIDQEPRPQGLTDAQAEALRRLARQVMSQLELRRALSARDALLAEQQAVLREREAERETQESITESGGDLDIILEALVHGVMQAVPTAEAGIIELIDGDELEYRAVQGKIAKHLGLRVPVHGSLAGSCALTNTPILVGDVLVDGRVKQDLVQVLGLRSAVLAPVVRGGKVLGVLKLQSSKPDAFTKRDLDLVRLFAGIATSGLTEAQEVLAQQAILASEARYRAVFDSATDYAIIVMDLEGRVTNWNSGAEKVLGWSAEEMLGQSTAVIYTPEDQAEGVPENERLHALSSGRGLDERWHIRKSGERFFALGELMLLRYEDGPVLGLVKFLRDRTEQQRIVERLKVSEKHKAALVELGDLLRDMTDASEMAHSAAEIAGRTLGVTRAGFGRVDTDVEWVHIERDWTTSGQVSIAGRHRFENYGAIRETLVKDSPLVIDDVRSDSRTMSSLERLLPLGIEALINTQVREHGRIVALFFVHDCKPRQWSPEDVGFLRAVADRVEAAIARAQAEEQQHVLNQELSHRLKNTLSMVQAIATQTLRGVTERDAVDAFRERLIALSQAHDLLLQGTWTAAPIRAVVAKALSLQPDPTRFDITGPNVNLGPKTVLSVSLVLHEMATNAAKYGAVSAPSGVVRVSWRVSDCEVDPEFVLSWTEEGGPPAVEPKRRGFGSRLIRMGLAGTGQTTLRYGSTGLDAEFRAPLNVVTDQ